MLPETVFFHILHKGSSTYLISLNAMVMVFHICSGAAFLVEDCLDPGVKPFRGRRSYLVGRTHFEMPSCRRLFREFTRIGFVLRFARYRYKKSGEAGQSDTRPYPEKNVSWRPNHPRRILRLCDSVIFSTAPPSTVGAQNITSISTESHLISGLPTPHAPSTESRSNSRRQVREVQTPGSTTSRKEIMIGRGSYGVFCQSNE